MVNGPIGSSGKKKLLYVSVLAILLSFFVSGLFLSFFLIFVFIVGFVFCNVSCVFVEFFAFLFQFPSRDRLCK